MVYSIEMKTALERVKNHINDIDRFRWNYRIPKIAIITVGQNPASEVYVRNKMRDLQECGMQAVHLELDGDTSKERIMSTIEDLNSNKTIDGIMVQMPLPGKFSKKDTTHIIDMINPLKDIDGLTYYNTLAIYNGNTPFFYPCTPYGIVQDIRGWCPSLRGKNVTIVGRSNIVGKPLAHMLMNRGATVTVCHRGTLDLGAATRNADILVVAAGKPGLVTKDMVSKEHDVYVYDVGINYVNGKMVGDVNIEPDYLSVGDSDKSEPNIYVTRVPGGVGQITRAALLKQLSNRVIKTHGVMGAPIDEWYY